MDIIKENTNCFACGETDLFTVLNLKEQPLANYYLNSPEDKEYRFPLMLKFCKNCTHLQLSHTVNPDNLFKNYLYVSGTSQTGMDHFENFVDISEKYVPNAKTVLDIACNDGSQLYFYKKKGYQTYGIDPAINLYDLSSKQGKIICDYLTQENIKSFGVEFDMILAQNVFAHNDYPVDFLKYCKSVLSVNGKIFVQTSQANMIENNEFDTVYHEHLSFFNVRSMAATVHRAGLSLIDVLKVPIHGTSYIFVIGKDGDRSEELIEQEKEINLTTMMFYSNNVYSILSNLWKTIEEYKYKKYKIIGYGAAAKGNTILNASYLKFDYIVDDNPLKHGLYTPGMHIPIKHPDVLKDETGNIAIVPLAWNFFDEIKEKVLQRNSNVIFIKYFPEISIQ
jgi:2-polyprenyl-3-methyl-5-hydroxy-6-metoxy-1,4-benzoquinol methylase